MIKVEKSFWKLPNSWKEKKGFPEKLFLDHLADAMVTAYKKHVKGTHVANIIAHINDK